MKDQAYQKFADVIFKICGVVYTSKDFYRLEARINQFMTRFSIGKIEELAQFLSLNAQKTEVVQAIIDLATNNETSFFRDQKPFQSLTQHMIPERKKMGRQQLKIWSAACSTGQEPLSIAMQILESFPEYNQFNLNMWATDISSRALEKCRSGIYSGLEVQRGLPMQLQLKYFEQSGTQDWKVQSKLSSFIKYDYFNLLDGLYPFQQFDMIFCRNVLIYHDIPNKQKIINKLFDALMPGGFLILGSGESMIGLKTDFVQVQAGSALAYAKPNSKVAAA
jgi:chemotaxis protein methyltransferase CheR